MSTIGKISITPEMAQNIAVMNSGVLHISELDVLRRALAENSTDENLAKIFAKTSNQTGKLFHMVDDPDKSFEENEKYLEEIKARLTKSNKENGTAYVTEDVPFSNPPKPFMEQNGYCDGSGWWIENG